MMELDPDRVSIDESSSPQREKLIHNEQVKLTATIVNGVALAFIVGGGVTTITGLGTGPSLGDQFLRASVWILAGIVLHLAARRYLRTLR